MPQAAARQQTRFICVKPSHCDDDWRYRGVRAVVAGTSNTVQRPVARYYVYTVEGTPAEPNFAGKFDCSLLLPRYRSQAN